MLNGFVPHSKIITDNSALFIALGIIGATIMPHNLYLHSSIVQTRMYDRHDMKSKAQAIKYAILDSNIQLSIAFVINCLLLILGAALFYGVNTEKLGGFYDLYTALHHQPILGASLGAIMSTLFAVALLASGQNSTITGTMAGQIVMEGFINLKIPNWLRRLITRLLAILPIIFCLIIFNSNEAKNGTIARLFSSIFKYSLTIFTDTITTCNKQLWINGSI
ncbi:manganese transport protein MntH [Staphylococcus gallinarum]|uniref:Manganese transport protein MntH n=1 Tax=Staphylococcus gallinarum TaxID=1293 RepID=A0A380FH19_STAGA|nr:manganese transport protein MntH [Staphylococcus gallinarum]